jgi:anti-anti-sigma regulatory factor
MLKISIIENGAKRQLILEGKLVAPWSNELKNISQEIASEHGHRELDIDLRNVTAISADGENVLLDLMALDAKFRGGGVFVRQVLKNLSRRVRLVQGTNERKKLCAKMCGSRGASKDKIV